MLSCFTEARREIRIGVAPVRRAVWAHKPFNLPEAIKYKEDILRRLDDFDAKFVNLEGVIQEGLLFDVADSERVARYFMAQDVDAVFIPHCNFGSEEAAARLCRMVG